MKKCYSLVKWAFSLVYYAFTSAYAYYILYHTDYLPTWLGGSGFCENCYKGHPSLPYYSVAMHAFYVMQFGKHFSRTFSHCFIRPEGNFYEYALHHSLSTFLIVFSYLINGWMAGVMTLFVHDISDCCLTICRGYRVIL